MMEQYKQDYYVMTQKPWKTGGGGNANNKASESESMLLGTPGIIKL